MRESPLWIEDEVRSFDIEVPAWIEQDITCSDVAAVLQGGCESGAYMPAVTYHQALATMAEHDEAILDMVKNTGATVPDVLEVGWYRFACWLVSAAVESWCADIEDELRRAVEERS